MDLNKFENANNDEKIIIINNLINNYNELSYNEYINIIKYININYNILNLEIFFKKISLLSIGHKLLNIINPIIINKNKINEYLIFTSKYGTYMTFIFWFNHSDYKDFDEIELSLKYKIIINSIKNTDNRLYIYLLEVIKKNKHVYENNNNFIMEIICTIYNTKKYFFQYLKTLSKIIDLQFYFNNIIKIVDDIKIIIILHKYYYNKPHDFITIKNLIYKNNIEIYIDDIYKILKTPTEKMILNINYSLIYNKKINDNWKINLNLFEDIIINNYIFIDIHNYNDLNLEIITILKKNNLINKYINGLINYNPYIILFTKYYYHPIIKNYYKYNLLLHYLRMYVKKKRKNKINNFKLKMLKIHNEILTFKPNINIPVLKNGSFLYQIQKQKFTQKEPRYLLPGEKNYLNNFLLKEKTEGIILKNIPFNIFPYNDLFHKYEIKTEYIEHLDLYLILDINIPNTTFLERYNLLKSMHPYTKNIYNSNFTQEKKLIITFLSENINYQIKWFPKLTIYENNINNILLNDNFKINEPYTSYGLILIPLNGSQEIKIVLKNYISVNLLYKNNIWIDNNNNIINNVISYIDLDNNSIYECNFINDIFIVKENKYNLAQPDSSNIINIIKFLDYNLIIEKTKIYYDYISNNILEIFKSFIISNNNILNNLINKLEADNYKNWLDLGCGSGKLLTFINKYNPYYYLGIDIDIQQLIKAFEKFPNNNFYPCDLNNKWNDYYIKWIKFNENIIYDYVIANFSLMHFMTDIFWEQLNIYTKTGTLFLFNLVRLDNINYKWINNKSFLHVDNNITKYKFEWVHNEIKDESYINDDILNYYLNKYNWIIITTYQDNKEFLNLYKWFIIKKI